MKRKSNRKLLRVYRLEHFENFSNYGLEGFPPLELINKASEFIRDKLNATKYKLRVDPKEIDFIADEMARMALAIQAFAINALKIFPFEGGPVNILDYKGIEFKKFSFLSETEFDKIKKEKKKYLEIVHKLYYLNEVNPTVIEDISISVKLKKNVNDSNHGKLKSPEKIKIPSKFHHELINSLTNLIEKLTGQINLHHDLNARENRSGKIIYLMSMDAILAYLREYIHRTNKNQKTPTDLELQFTVLILVTAGMLPTEKDYPASILKRKNGTRPVRKRFVHKILKETKEIPRNRGYETRMIEVLKEVINHNKKSYYQEDSGYFNINELIGTFDHK